MNESPLVDIIIPTYNGLPYLTEAVESVLKQTHTNWLLYIIDDGSSDKTEEYAKSIGDSRIKYLKRMNGGQAAARNFGIRVSDSPFVALLDADDAWYPEKLAKQLNLFKENPETALVYGFHDVVDAENRVTGKVNYAKRGDLFEYLLHGNRISGSASMVLVKREAFDKVGYFREDLLIGEDWEMWLRIARYYPIDYVPEYLAALRVLGAGLQKNHVKMAEGLRYMYPIMVKEFDLPKKQRQILAGTCLFDALIHYRGAQDNRANARAVLFELLKNNPRYLLRVGNWFLYFRTLIANRYLFRISSFLLGRKIKPLDDTANL